MAFGIDEGDVVAQRFAIPGGAQIWGGANEVRDNLGTLCRRRNGGGFVKVPRIDNVDWLREAGPALIDTLQSRDPDGVVNKAF